VAGVRPLGLTQEPDPPGAGEVEVSIFGRGVGECVVVHLGNAEWLVVDSFVTPRRAGADALSLAYLAALEVPPEAVKVVVATHWDDDHIRGLARVVTASPDAMFVCSAALRRKEAVGFFEQHQQRTMGGKYTSGVREFIRILDALRSSGRPRPKWALQDTLLARSGESTVTALAPSPETFNLSVLAVIAAIPANPPVGTSVREQTPNNSSVVLWLEIGGHRVVLGGDLEAGPNPALGWKAILDSLTPNGATAAAFKVPHHGSEDADESPVWDRLLTSNSLSGLTPYTRLAEPLPTATDIERLLSRRPDTFLAGRPSPRRHPPPLVRRMVAAATRSGIRPVTGPIGQVRLRARNGEAWRVDTFGSAVPLTSGVLSEE
jgi:hypothetical protein